MGKLKFTFSNIILWLSVAAACLLLEDVGFLSTNPTGPLNETHFFMLFTLSLGGFLSYFLIEHIKNKVTMDFFLIGILFICFACGMIPIWQFNGFSVSAIRSYEYSVNIWDKVHQTLLLLIYIVAIYAIMFYFGKNYPSISKFKIVYILIIIIGLVSSIYSWIREFDAIMYNLTSKTGPVFVNSFFWNPNMFSLMLLLGMFSCFGLNYYKKNPFSYICMAFFALMIFVVASLTAVAVCFTSLLLYFIIEIIFTMRRSVARGMTGLAIYLTILVTFVVLFICGLHYDMGGFSKFCVALYKYFANARYSDLNMRGFTWGHIVEYLKEHPLSFFVGTGFKNSYRIVGGYWYAYLDPETTSLSAHSGYMQILMNFGLVGIFFYALLFIYYIYAFFRLLRKNGRFALIFILIGLSLMGYAVMESIIFLNTNTLGLLIFAFFYLPLLIKWKHYRHKNLGDDVIEVSKPALPAPRLITKSLTKMFMALTIVILSFLAFPVFREIEEARYFIINMAVTSLICAFTVPFIISCISVNHKKGTFIFLTILNFVIISTPIIYLGVRFYLRQLWMPANAEWIFPVMIVLILVGECIIFGVGKRQKFKDYLATLVGMSKNSFMGLLGAGVIIIITCLILDRIDTLSFLTYIIYPVIVLVAFYLASYLVPFKDQKEFIANYNQSLIYSMKMNVLKDRLGDFNEKRRD